MDETIAPVSNEAPSLRDSLIGAINEVEPEDSPLREPATSQEGKPSGQPGDAKPAAKPAATPAGPTGPVGPVGTPPQGATGAQQVQPGQTGATGAPQAPVATELKPPSQWKPQVREKWSQIPREVQEEILRRESDNLRLVGAVGQKIKLADEVSHHIAPFAEQLQARNVPPQEFLSDVFTTVRTLAHGQQNDKAMVIANMIQAYGVDLRVLDSVLHQRLSAPPPHPEVLEARRLAAQAQAALRSRAVQEETQASTEANQVLAAFAADPKNEFFDDVRFLVADLLESGQAKTLDEAYSAAIWAMPDTRKILLQRESEQRAASRQRRADNARTAGSAARGAPTSTNMAPATTGLSLRETISTVVDDLSNS